MSKVFFCEDCGTELDKDNFLVTQIEGQTFLNCGTECLKSSLECAGIEYKK